VHELDKAKRWRFNDNVSRNVCLYGSVL